MLRADGLQIACNPKDSSFDDNQQTNLPTPPKSENTMPAAAIKAKVARTKAATGGIKARTKRTSAGVAKFGNKGAATKAKGKREALTDISNRREAQSDTEEVDDFDELNDGAGVANAQTMDLQMEEIIEQGTAKPGSSKKGPTTQSRRGRPARKQNVEEIPETQEDVTATSKLAKTTAAPKQSGPHPRTREQVPETQPEPMDVDESISGQVEQQDSEPRPHERETTNIPSTSASRRDGTAIPGRRAGSASDTERGTHDPTLRKKLANMTKKFEALEVKYQNVYEVGVGEAESNFEKLRKQTEWKTKAANDLVASLRAELAVQKAAAAEAASFQKQIATLKSQNETLALEKKNLATTLNTAQNENKTLQVKLAATRSTSNPAQSSDTAAQRAAGARTILVSTAEAAKEAQKRMLKEDFYSDLTGLVLLDVRRRDEEGEDVYDCIQTGRNGTLHFHLTVANPIPHPNSKAANTTPPSYEDAEFQYTPLLDEKRDKDLIEILPDYLTEEICFPRSNAAKFYSRVADCMTKKIELIEE